MNAPIDMILFCPACGLQHVDEPAPNRYPNGDPGGGNLGVAMDVAANAARWTNPPHRSHLCAGCDHIWRPADVATNGVREIQTCGANDSPTARGRDHRNVSPS